MAKMTSTKFVEKAIDIAKNYKTLYVMGCFGAPLSSSNVDRYCNNHPFNRQSPRPSMIREAANRTPRVFGFDCSCLIKAILWGWSGKTGSTYGGATYASNGVPDLSADGLISKCSGVSTGGWADMAPGEVLWMPEHIGIYIGDGLCVECTPAWKNCVQITAVGNIGAKAGYSTRTWRKHGKLPYVDYSAKAAAPINHDKAATPDAIDQTIQNAVKDIGMDSPDYWEDVLRGKKTATAGNIKALMDKYHAALVKKS